MIGGVLFVLFIVVLFVILSSVGELKNIGQFNGIYSYGYEKFLSVWYIDFGIFKGECVYYENVKYK